MNISCRLQHTQTLTYIASKLLACSPAGFDCDVSPIQVTSTIV